MNPEIAACGLYCGACSRYLKRKCPGCLKYEKATWCKVRMCCLEHGRQSCADCTDAEPSRCPKFNGFMSKVFAVVFRSDRAGCIRRIREVGYEAFAAEMRLAGCMNRPVKKK